MSAICERVVECLSPFLDGELPAAEAAGIRAHVDTCPPCAGAHRRLAALEVISERLLRTPPAIAPAEWGLCRGRLDGAALASSGRRRRPASGRKLVRLAVAMAVLVAGGLALVLLCAPGRETPESSAGTAVAHGTAAARDGHPGARRATRARADASRR
jgi:anti-sigma factor RsiW